MVKEERERYTDPRRVDVVINGELATTFPMRGKASPYPAAEAVQGVPMGTSSQVGVAIPPSMSLRLTSQAALSGSTALTLLAAILLRRKRRVQRSAWPTGAQRRAARCAGPERCNRQRATKA